MKAKHILIVFFCIGFLKAHGQYLRDVNGRPITLGQYIDVEGTPYLSENWSKGSVKISPGNTLFKDIELKYDMVADRLLFKGENGDPLEFVESVTWFKISHSKDNTMKEDVFQNGFQPIDGNDEQTYYQLIADGPTRLLKKTKKYVKESKAYSSSVLVKTMEQNSNYYLVKPTGAIAKIKTDKKSLVAAMGVISADVSKFIQENNLNLKDEANLAKIIAFYNEKS